MDRLPVTPLRRVLVFALVLAIGAPPEGLARLRRLVSDGDDKFQLTADGDGGSRISWRGKSVARRKPPTAARVA